MKKIAILKILIVFLLVVLAMVSVYFFRANTLTMVPGFQKINKAQNTTYTQKKSTFGTVIKNGNNQDYNQVPGAPLEDPSKMLAFKYGLGDQKLDPTVLWDYKTVPFQAEVTAIDAASNTITLKFASPDSMPFIGKEKTYKSPCTPDITYIYISSENKTYSGDQPKIKRNLGAGDNLMSFCLDEQCSEIGRLCRSVY